MQNGLLMVGLVALSLSGCMGEDPYAEMAQGCGVSMYGPVAENQHQIRAEVECSIEGPHDVNVALGPCASDGSTPSIVHSSQMTDGIANIRVLADEVLVYESTLEPDGEGAVGEQSIPRATSLVMEVALEDGYQGTLVAAIQCMPRDDWKPGNEPEPAPASFIG